jgi:hypothetical protein
VSVIRALGRTGAIVECVCGLRVTVERDECGASVPTFACEQPGCETRLCEHNFAECRDCGAKVCREHAVSLSGRIVCHVCALAEVEEGAEEIAEVSRG